MKTTILTSAPCSQAAIAALLTNLESHSHLDVDIVITGFPGIRPEPFPEPIQFLSFQEQLALLSSYSPDLARCLGHDASIRTMAGLFQTWLNGSSQVLFWDGRLPEASQDFLAAHREALSMSLLPHISTAQGWCNIYSLLNIAGDKDVFPTGFPLELRKANLALPNEVSEPRPSRVVANFGLPIGPLDMDSISRLERVAKSNGWSQPGTSLALASGTWSPLPAANLMLRREAIPAYFLCGHLQSYGAVWASLLLQRIAGHLGDVVAIGAPFVARMPDDEAPLSDPWIELDRERPGLRRTGELAHVLRTLPLHGGTYSECIQQVAVDLPFAWPQGSLRGPNAWSGYSVDWRKRFLEGLKFWAEACESAAAQSKANLHSALESAQQTTASLTTA